MHPITRAEFAAIAARFDDKNTNTTRISRISLLTGRRTRSVLPQTRAGSTAIHDSNLPSRPVYHPRRGDDARQPRTQPPARKSEDLLDDMIKWPDNGMRPSGTISPCRRLPTATITRQEQRRQVRKVDQDPRRTRLDAARKVNLTTGHSVNRRTISFILQVSFTGHSRAGSNSVPALFTISIDKTDGLPLL